MADPPFRNKQRWVVPVREIGNPYTCWGPAEVDVAWRGTQIMSRQLADDLSMDPECAQWLPPVTIIGAALMLSRPSVEQSCTN